jgi:hypothetical protein
VPTGTQLVGIDIESVLFPPPSGLPSNVTFHKESILHLPPEWTNKFALVHQRCLVGSLRRNEWIIAITNIYNSLKPGGWLQLFEADDWINTGPMLQSFNAFTENYVKVKRGEGLYPGGHFLWKKIMEEAGFVDIHVRLFETPVGKWAGLDGADMEQVLIGFVKGLKEVILQNDGFGVMNGGEEEYTKWMEAIQKEVQEGSTKPACQWAMVLGKKPPLAE